MKTLQSFNEVQETITREGIHLLYASRKNCGVCVALRPKVEEMVKNFPELKIYYIDLDQVPMAGGQLSIFTIPGILVFVDGKEYIREARYISIDDLEGKIRRIYNLLNKD